MNGALAIIPQGSSLVEREPQVAAWIDDQEDGAVLAQARALLAAWRQHSERGSAERDAAIRLDIRCERRLGQLPEAAPKPDERDRVTGRYAGEPTPTAERMALSRARALAAIPAERFEEVLAAPKPSREKLLTEAVMPIRTVDPVLDESSRMLRLLQFPTPVSWPDQSDVSLLDEKAVASIRDAVDSWRRWADRWEGALASFAELRRIK
jgi:hypothetical protein